MAPRTPATGKTKSTKSKTGTKSAAKLGAKTVAQKTVPVSTAPAPTEVPETTVVTTVKKKEFIDRVAEASGIKRGEAKKAIEATLKELGDALQRGDDLNLPPLGKISVNRQRDGGGAHVIVAKLRRSKAMLGEEGETADAAGESAEAEN